ncbi:MAG: hypothetical protein M5U12_15190 [Verrucomicrobia bacterium]|nr:hypothetical protein [Verrucomicrobiota bacterium]
MGSGGSGRIEAGLRGATGGDVMKQGVFVAGQGGAVGVGDGASVAGEEVIAKGDEMGEEVGAGTGVGKGAARAGGSGVGAGDLRGEGGAGRHFEFGDGGVAAVGDGRSLAGGVFGEDEGRLVGAGAGEEVVGAVAGVGDLDGVAEKLVDFAGVGLQFGGRTGAVGEGGEFGGAIDDALEALEGVEERVERSRRNAMFCWYWAWARFSAWASRAWRMATGSSAADWTR